MKLEINFMIKAGRKIVSRETKGFESVLTQVEKEFKVIKTRKTVKVDVIIQTSLEGAKNKRNYYSAWQGVYTWKQADSSFNKITVWAQNCKVDKIVNQVKILEVLAHELGHCWDRNCNPEFLKTSILKKEKFADDFANKIIGYKKECSATGKTPYSRKG